ncbi:5'-deoxynucleotidase [Acidaminobacterium chupaoyuni]
MQENAFFALLFRMKYIDRWGLMRSAIPENLSEHALETALIAHALATLANTYYGENVPAESIASAALFHDVSEILTGDLPTPVKYHDPALRKAYHQMESGAKNSLLETLPKELRAVYQKELFCEDQRPELYRYIKAADKISAYLKCVEERKSGNTEFESAAQQLKAAILALELPAADHFMRVFVPAFSLTLDQQQNGAFEEMKA